jgi:5-hydroxyisourate hydrolase-like protein (transthyretin family)
LKSVKYDDKNEGKKMKKKKTNEDGRVKKEKEIE